MSDLSTFDVFGSGMRFGTTPDDTPYVVATDLARALEYRDAAAVARIVDSAEQGYENVSTPGGDQRMIVLYEDGIWEAIFQSRKPQAKALKGRVKAILRELRQTGSVGVPDQRDRQRIYDESYVVAFGSDFAVLTGREWAGLARQLERVDWQEVRRQLGEE